jgi:NAD(P)-dependent dehydrogenase (short-subunit alcohol dehydrogenase family)
VTKTSSDLNGKVALVTGATKGLGYGIAIGLAQCGADVVVVSRTASDCERVAEEIRGLGRKALAAPTDVSRLADIQQLVERSVEEMGSIDVLVNNAGSAVTRASVDLTEDEWDQVLGVNLKGVFMMAQAVGRQMIEQKRGKIINIASVAGLVGLVSLLPYCASKGGVIQLTKALALEWARYNIQVNCVSPGYVKTPMNEKELSDPQILQGMLRKIPARRLGTAEDIAGAVVYLASDASDYVTGSNLVVDGGWTCE